MQIKLKKVNYKKKTNLQMLYRYFVVELLDLFHECLCGLPRLIIKKKHTEKINNKQRFQTKRFKKKSHNAP